MAGFLDPRQPAPSRPSGIGIDENGDYFILSGADDAAIFPGDDGGYYLGPKDGTDPAPQDGPAPRILTSGFDFANSPPAFYTTLNLPAETVLQSMTINETTNEIYTTQVAKPNPDPSESYTIGRLTIDGILLDSMTLIHGGHGTTIGLETIGSDVYIWSNYDQVDGSGNHIGNDLVRFKYTPGATWNETASGLVRYNKFGTDYVSPTNDQKAGTICFRRTVAGKQTLELRTLVDVKAGTDRVLGTVTIPDDVAYMQGACIDGDFAYWYTGDTNAVTVPSSITRYRFSTGEQDRKVPCTFGLSPDGITYEDNFREPESVTLYTDPETGLKTLFAGVVTGEATRRIAKIYGFHQQGNDAKFQGYRTQAAQGYKLTLNNGYVKRLPIGTTLLASIKSPGHYYATSAEMAAMTDAPFTGWGCFIDVTPYEVGGSVRQTVEANTLTPASERIERRLISGATPAVAGPWRTLHIGQRKTIPAGTTTIASLPAGNWYADTTAAAALTDNPNLASPGGWHIDKTPPNSSGDQITTASKATGTTANVRAYYKVGAAAWIAMLAGGQDWVSIPLDPAAAVGWSTPQAALVENGTFVALQGSFVLSGAYSSGMTIGTLPAGYRPTATRRLGVAIDDGAGGRTQIAITSAGLIQLYGTVAATKKVLLDGLRFGI